MDWINATGTFISAPPVLDGHGEQFSGCFSDIPATIAKYARIKLFVIGSNSPGHCDSNTGLYNGTIGMLQRNQADYIVVPTGYHALIGSQCSNSNVIVSTTVNQCEASIISTPTSGDHHLTIIKTKNLHELFFVFDSVSFWLLFLSIVTVFFVSKVSVFVLKKVKRSLRNKRKKHKLPSNLWTIICLALKQEVPKSCRIVSTTNSALFFGLELFFLFVVSITLSAMNTELVVYSQPELIDTLEQLLESNKTIYFDSGTGFHQEFGQSLNPFHRKIYSRSIVHGTNGLLDFHHKLLKNNIALMSYLVTTNLVKNFECREEIGLNTMKNNSSLHLSKSVAFSTPAALLMNSRIGKVLKDRLEKFYLRGLEGGLFGLMMDHGADIAMDSIPPYHAPSQSCLNTYPWDKNTNDVNGIHWDVFVPFFFDCFYLILFSAIIAFFEYLFNSFMMILIVEPIDSEKSNK